jgi:MFS family permease
VRSRFTGLWRHPDFLKLWAGQTISLFGSQVTLLALPLTAVVALDATPAQMGLLGAAEFAPFLLLGLFAGVWVDRLRRRPLMIAADLGRAALLGSIPAAAFSGVLRMELLYAVGFLVGVLTVFFDVAYQAYLPSLVRREELVEGNSKLEVSRSVAQIAGPGVAGGLVQAITAPVTLVVDALSFLVSAASLGIIRVPEPAPAPREHGRNIWAEIAEGLQVVLGNPLLRSIAGCTATSNFFSNVLFAVYVLFVTRELRIEPAVLGLIFSIGSVGALLGALLAGRIAQQFGLGPTIAWVPCVGAPGGLLVPLASGSRELAIPLLVVSQFLIGLTGPIYNVNQVSLRQAITPDRLQGRMNASMRFIVWGTLPLGSLLGGALGERFGLQSALLVGAVGVLLAPLWVVFSPVRNLREAPVPAEEPASVMA